MTVRAPMSSVSAASTPSRALVAALSGMLALGSSLGIGRFVYTPILPAMAAALGMSAGEAGLIASANFAGYLAGGIVAMAPRLPGGRRAWFVGGLSVGAATTTAMGLVEGLPAFLLLRFLGGASSAFVLVLGTGSVLDALARSGRSSLRWIHYAGVGLGIATSAVAVSALEAMGASWRALWLAAGLTAAAMLVAPALILRWREARAAGPALSVRPGAGVLPLAVCHGLFGFGYVVTATFLVAMARQSASARAIEPLLWVTVGLSAFPSLLVWDRIARGRETKRRKPHERRPEQSRGDQQAGRRLPASA
ncbi:MAG: YbfB/YjiJ family MFS transporter [Acetobacteraceae bacterium]|nr:YbfB/YjiJ family MFS transporter [Acetobacteraceae bacterium]